MKKEKICRNLGLLESNSSILEQKLECLNRTLTSLNSGFYSVTAHEYSFKTRAISKEKEAASSGEIAAEFHRPPPLIENPDHFSYSSSYKDICFVLLMTTCRQIK